MSGLKAEIARVNKLREGVQRRLRIVEEQKGEVESKRESLKQQIASFERGEGYGCVSVGVCMESMKVE